MQIQPKYPPLAMSQLYLDGRSARPVPEGTVALGESEYDSAVNDGTQDGSFVSTIPVPVTADLVERGRDRFDIFCSPCHGRTGNGDGVIARRGVKQPADLNDDRVRNAPPGYIYQVIANGYGAMASYSYQIKDPRDRWAIVSYIRALEASRSTSIQDAPPSERARLEAQK
jgi:mono/diheme cytochrome c family protein